MRYYQDRFKNFYATAIQQAWINCKKRSSEKKAIHCDKDYYFINGKIIEFNNVADRFHDLAEKKKRWVDMTKWVQNPDYLNSKVSNSRWSPIVCYVFIVHNDRQVDVKVPISLSVKLGLFLSPRTGF
ncbi:unnamed protein product [Rhizophagus irregularis]|nr:unnamed protein product [Rhizophagus irregularis]